jgi:hypothetical protein
MQGVTGFKKSLVSSRKDPRGGTVLLWSAHLGNSDTVNYRKYERAIERY